jgi:hypothetical protein
MKVEVGDYMLIAFLNVSKTFKMDSNEINRQIKAKLPSYMVPTVYKFMQDFPRTINGKIDRQALNFDLNELKSEERKETKSLTPTEKIIHKIWSEALKIEDISVRDNFFNIGGNSLMAISVFLKVELALNVELGLKLFFDSPRIEDLAEIIDVLKHKEVEQKSFNKTKSDSRIIKGEI